MQKLLVQLKNDILENNIDKHSIESVFIGGGTPSSVEFELYKPIFEFIKDYLKDDAEITSEANPNSATLNWLVGMKHLGINRVSFGIQSFDEKKLKYLGRAHSKDDAIKAIKNAKNAGFENINGDLIYGVHGDSLDLIANDIKILNDLGITHISAYSLTLEEGTKFENKPYTKIDDEELAQDIFKLLEKYGFNQYEISNFAKNNLYSKHNFGYWEYKEYFGIGAGAVGRLGCERLYPLKDVNEYIKNPLYKDIEQLSIEDIRLEKILLGLRSMCGFSESIVENKEKLQILVKEKKLLKKDSYIYNNDFLLSDEIALFISE